MLTFAAKKMKKTIVTIILSAIVLAALFIEKPAMTGVKESPVDKVLRDSGDTLSAEPDSSLLERERLVNEELKYYLERHNVQDEGYEMVVAFANGHRHEIEIDPNISVWNVGTWACHQHEGTGVALDTLGQTIVGTWDTDTLETGVRLDTLGTYVGDFSGLWPHGHGAYLQENGSYFEGHWEEGLRQGFGLQMLYPKEGEPLLRVGEWQKDKFQGERMRYTTERIYGIDIARYQHGKGRKTYAINWNQMRITYLGNKGHKNVSGEADYPVSFIFIKSTEGISIRNRYYAGDYLQARRHGIKTGAYHFFSVRTNGTAQAQFFLRNTLFNKGDLPPVLDVEPSDAQIRQMGGVEKMFAHIRIWLKAVESKVGVKPILYVNQRFVNLYLSQAPDIKRDYRVWIARYGEYKPDVRLAFWQLCPDGRVKGIRGEVDINVFNGYKSQFEDFIEEETIK